MDQGKLTKSIKENKGILRQLTSLNNEIRQLRGRVRKLEKGKNVYPFTEKELLREKIGGTD